MVINTKISPFQCCLGFGIVSEGQKNYIYPRISKRNFLQKKKFRKVPNIYIHSTSDSQCGFAKQKSSQRILLKLEGEMNVNVLFIKR